MTRRFADRSSRAAFLKAAAATGIGARVADAAGREHVLASNEIGPCTDTIHTILDTALVAERITMTLYYTALTSPRVVHSARLAGPSVDPNHPALPPRGQPGHVKVLQAALDAEIKHADLLMEAGAWSPINHFYFPPTTFIALGATQNRGSFLGIMDLLETLCEQMYVMAAGQLLRLGHPNLALLAGEMMGVESEHCALGRVIAGAFPANNLTLRKEPLSCSSEAAMALHPFITGQRFLFASDSTRAIPVPTRAQAARVIGTHGTRRVKRYL